MIFTQPSALVLVAFVLPVGIVVSDYFLYHFNFAPQWALASTIVGSEISRRQLTSNGPNPGWNYVACYRYALTKNTEMRRPLKGEYSDMASARTLSGPSEDSSQMTPSICTAFCQGGGKAASTGYNYAGMEYGDECCEFHSKPSLFGIQLR
jgi:hypothetical protein